MRRALSFAAIGLAHVLAACTSDRGEEGAKAPPPEASADAGDASPPIEATDAGPADASPPPYPFPLPNGFPAPLVPASNPLTKAKVELGRHLFYDERLSGNGTQSCASCHEQARAFTDGRALAIGSTGDVHPRNSMTLANVAYASSLTWANPVLTSLEVQAGVPIAGIDPIVELGVRGKEEEVLARFRAEPKYGPLFADAFGADGGDPVTFDNVHKALASFQRTLVSGRSRFDRYQNDKDPDALTAQEKRGLELFGSETLECFHCHGGFTFTDAITYVNVPNTTTFHNTGLYNIGGTGAFPDDNRGLIDFTNKPKDMGRFKAPTLRNIEKTAPYMHDGSIATLEDVVEHYAAGGRTITEGPHAGIGSQNPFKSGFIVSFSISAEDKAALIAFLKSLTDEAFLTDPALANPWQAK